MHIPSLVDHFGENSFNHPCEKPWDHLLQHSTGDIAAGLRHASSQIKQIFEEVAIDGTYDPEKCLALQGETRIGFHHNGTRPASVTHALTEQLETMEYEWWLKEVRSLPTSRYDRWAFECCDVFSQQVMLAAPNAMGHLGNDEFVLVFTRYMGQKNYITRSMEGLYFGKKGFQVNANATTLCCASLPGGGFRVLHDKVKTLIITFLRLAGVEADEESALWMLGKVRDPFMKRYIDSLLRAQAADKRNPEGSIVADFVAWDLPTAKQASNDSGLGSRSDALGEVKTMQPGKSSYQKGNCQENRPVDQRATQVRRNYKRRAAGLDLTHAPEVVGDGTNKWSGGSIRGGPWNILHRQRPPPCCRCVRRSQ